MISENESADIWLIAPIERVRASRVNRSPCVASPGNASSALFVLPYNAENEDADGRSLDASVDVDVDVEDDDVVTYEEGE